MSNEAINNHINLYLAINKNADNSYHYQYICRLDNGVEVDLKGLVISEATEIKLQLTHQSEANFKITECLIPCDQKTITAQIEKVESSRLVTIIDLNNERKPKDYNFIIIAKDRNTHHQIVCDPQVRNKGTMN